MLENERIFTLSTAIFSVSLEILNSGCPVEAPPRCAVNYADAVDAWIQRGRDPLDFFETDDPFLLKFRKVFQSRFGLDIISFNEIEQRRTMRRVMKKHLSKSPEFIQ